eukprot:6207182-Pleurochrysis_carterae.AAC.4
MCSRKAPLQGSGRRKGSSDIYVNELTKSIVPLTLSSLPQTQAPPLSRSPCVSSASSAAFSV